MMDSPSKEGAAPFEKRLTGTLHKKLHKLLKFMSNHLLFKRPFLTNKKLKKDIEKIIKR